MPYIKPEERCALKPVPRVNTTGELQYVIAEMVQEYLSSREVVNYNELENVMGAIAGALHEFQRQVVDPYEDTKIKENGAVYNTSMHRRGGY